MGLEALGSYSNLNKKDKNGLGFKYKCGPVVQG